MFNLSLAKEKDEEWHTQKKLRVRVHLDFVKTMNKKKETLKWINRGFGVLSNPVPLGLNPSLSCLALYVEVNPITSFLQLKYDQWFIYY